MQAAAALGCTPAELGQLQTLRRAALVPPSQAMGCSVSQHVQQRAGADACATGKDDTGSGDGKRGGGERGGGGVIEGEGEGEGGEGAPKRARPAGAADGRKKAAKQRRFAFKQAVLRRCRLLSGLPEQRVGREKAQRLSAKDTALLQALRPLPEHSWVPSHAQEAQEQAAAAAAAAMAAASGGAEGTRAEARLARALAELDPSRSLRDPDAVSCRGSMTRSEYTHGMQRDRQSTKPKGWGGVGGGSVRVISIPHAVYGTFTTA